MSDITTERKIITKYTRKVEREYNEVLLNGAKLVNWEVETDARNIWLANDYLIMSLYWMWQEELDNLDPAEYKVLLAEVGKVKNPLSTKA